MKYYFGSIENKNVLDPEDMFVAKSLFNHSFFYGIEYGSGISGLDEFTIYDTCGRRVPIHIECISELISALMQIQDQYEDIRHAEAVKDKLEDSSKEIAVVHADDDDDEESF